MSDVWYHDAVIRWWWDDTRQKLEMHLRLYLRIHLHNLSSSSAELFSHSLPGRLVEDTVQSAPVEQILATRRTGCRKTAASTWRTRLCSRWLHYCFSLSLSLYPSFTPSHSLLCLTLQAIRLFSLSHTMSLLVLHPCPLSRLHSSVVYQLTEARLCDPWQRQKSSDPGQERWFSQHYCRLAWLISDVLWLAKIIVHN